MPKIIKQNVGNSKLISASSLLNCEKFSTTRDTEIVLFKLMVTIIF